MSMSDEAKKANLSEEMVTLQNISACVSLAKNEGLISNDEFLEIDEYTNNLWDKAVDANERRLERMSVVSNCDCC